MERVIQMQGLCTIFSPGHTHHHKKKNGMEMLLQPITMMFCLTASGYCISPLIDCSILQSLTAHLDAPCSAAHLGAQQNKPNRMTPFEREEINPAQPLFLHQNRSGLLWISA
jgi:hypothetical protein